VHPTSSSNPSLPASSVLGALGRAGFEIGPAVATGHTVLDTFDGRLHDAGSLLELVDGPDAALVLTSGPAGATTAAPPPPARLGWTGPAPAWPQELPPGPFRQRLAAITKERALLPAFTMRSTARVARRRDKRGKVVVSVEVHEQITTPGAPPWVATVVPVAGHAGAAADAEQLLRRLDAPPAAGGASVTVARLAGVSLAGTASSPSVPLVASDDALVAYRAVLANLAETIEVNLPGTVADVDSEFLHELRVAVRRSRSVLSGGKGIVPEEVRDRFGGELRWLGQITTDPRDLDVYILGWSDYVAPLPTRDASLLEPVRVELERRRVAAHEQLATDLRGERATGALASWRRWLTAERSPGDDGSDVAVGPVVARRIAKLQRGLLRDGRAIGDDTPGERLHDLRKDAKKLRYHLECFGGLLESKPRKAFVGHLKALQDNLGEHQDAEIHVDQLRHLGRDLHGRPGVDADVLLAMGRLSDHLDRRRQAARDEFAERFASYDTKANRAALDDLLEPLRHPAGRSS
jgi:CHAD domain-containing protein